MCIILDWTAGPIEAKLSGSIEEIASLAHYAAYQQHKKKLLSPRHDYMKCSQFSHLHVKYNIDHAKNRPCAHERVIVGESITGNKKFNQPMFHKILEIPPRNFYNGKHIAGT